MQIGRLGKQEYKFDERTLALASYYKAAVEEIHIPPSFDVDKGRRKFPTDNGWGNFDYGNCVSAGQANHTLRLERIEQRHTLHFTAEDVIAEYKRECEREFGEAPQEPGDANDNGLVVLDSLRNWRKIGWPVGKHNYNIFAFGALDQHNEDELKASIYLLHGVQLGFWLPNAAQQMTDDGKWDYNGESGPDYRPGSWGGHLVYAKKYDENSIYVMTWDVEIEVTQPFIDKYCDEAWGIVDDLDAWRKKQAFDVSALEADLRNIGAIDVEG